jgi:hypothetical protein
LSKATSIYDNLVAKIAATLTAYIDLPEAYDIEENPSFLLEKGFGVGFLSEVNEKLQNCNILNFEREFSIILVNRLTATINDRTQRAAAEKALIEDGYTLIKALMNDLTLSGVATDTSYEGQSGIEYVIDKDGTERFISIALSVLIKYQDTY